MAPIVETISTARRSTTPAGNGSFDARAAASRSVSGTVSSGLRTPMRQPASAPVLSHPTKPACETRLSAAPSRRNASRNSETWAT